MATPPSQRPCPPWVKWVSTAWLVSMFPSSGCAMVSVMLFDAPGSENSPLTILMAAGMMSAPVVLLFAGIAGLVLVRFAKRPATIRVAKVVALLPLVNVAVVVVATVLITVLCGGKLRC